MFETLTRPTSGEFDRLHVRLGTRRRSADPSKPETIFSARRSASSASPYQIGRELELPAAACCALAGSSAFSTAHCGARRALGLKQQTLGGGVLFHGAVKIQMIAREIGEDRGMELEAVNAAERQRVRGDLHGQVRAAALAPDSAAKRMTSSDSGVVLGAGMRSSRQAIFDGSDQAGDLARGAQNRVDQVRGGGFAVGAGDSGERYAFIRLPVEIARGDRQRLPAVLHFNPGAAKLSRYPTGHRRLAHERTRTLRDRVSRKLAAVDARSWKCKKHEILLHPARIVLQARDRQRGPLAGSISPRSLTPFSTWARVIYGDCDLHRAN